jgi:uncharacterized protein YhfF
MNRNKRTQFWGEDENDDHLILQIINRDKTATCCPAEFFNVPEGNFHDGGFEIGDLVDVYDLNEILRCVIRINDIYQTTLGNVPDKLWHGEYCTSAEEFLDEHFNCWKELNVSQSTKITATHFELHEVIYAKS